MNLKKLVFTFSILFLTASLHAQFSLKLTEQHRLLKQGMDAFEAGHFQTAQHLTQQYAFPALRTPSICTLANDDLYLSTAIFYHGLAALYLNQDSAIEQLTLFLKATAFEALRQYGNFKIARFLFAQQNFVQAIPFYEKASITYLSNAEIIQRNFELAYCYLLDNQLDKVSPLFASIKDVRSEYSSPGNYYHGVLTYYKGDYDAALSSFESLQSMKEYQQVVPFYIAELNYFKGDKNAALQRCLDYMVDTAAPYYGEMAQLAGHVYYEKGQWENAQNFLNEYSKKQQTVGNEDLFRMGYIHYQLKQYDQAAENFKKVNNQLPNVYAQALYYLGLANVKLQKNLQAYDAFKFALATAKLPQLEEDITFTMAKLAYDMEKNDEALNDLANFIQRYPQSQFLQDALEMKLQLHIKSKDYGQAANTLKQFANRSPANKALYQKVHYAQGIQLLMEGKESDAASYFQASKKYATNENLTGLAEFWAAECYFRIGQYENATDAINRFVAAPGASNSPALIRSAYLTNAYIFRLQNENDLMTQAYKNYLDTPANLTTAFVLNKMDSVKPNFVPSHVPQIETTTVVANYEIPSLPVKFSYKPLPLAPVALTKTERVEVQDNFIQLGLGNLSTTQLSLGYDLSNDIGEKVYLNLSHRASKSANFLQQASTNQLNLNVHKLLGDFDTKGVINLERNVYRPYGTFLKAKNLPDDFDLRNRFLDFNASAALTPLKQQMAPLNYQANVGIGAYNINSQGANWSGTELSFYLNTPFSYQLNETVKANVGLELQANGLIWASQKSAAKPANTSSSFVVLKPSLTNTYRDIKLDIGLFAAVGQQFYLLPNITISKKLDVINALAKVGVESELYTNSYRQLSRINPFIQMVNLQQSKQMLVYGQLSGAILDNVNYQIKTGGGVIRNLPLFVNDTTTNQFFDVWYEARATIMSLQANVEYHLNFNTNAGVQFHYQPIINNQLFNTNYHYVPLEFNAYAKYAMNEKLFMRADFFLRSMTTPLRRKEVSSRTIPGGYDLNFQADYRFAKKWTGHLELNNLLNNKYQRWINYPNFGFNALIGIKYSFNTTIKQLFTNQTGKQD